MQHESFTLVRITDRVEVVAQADDATITVTPTVRTLNNMDVGQFSFRIEAADLYAMLDAIPAATAFSVPKFATFAQAISALRERVGGS